MMRKLLILFLLSSLVVGGCSRGKNMYPKVMLLEVSNPLKASRKNIPIFVSLEDIKKKFPDFNTGYYVLRDREAPIAGQIRMEVPWYPGESQDIYIPDKLHVGTQIAGYDDNFYGLSIVLDSMHAGETRTVTAYYNPADDDLSTMYGTKRTQAELSHKIKGEWKDREYIGGQFQNVSYLRVPPEHKDHSWFLRYEGPGWESNLVGYRLYLDQRNAIDVFGKTTRDMVLMGVGQDGFDSYHEMQEWGMDVMKVGKSLGLGSLGMWVDSSAVRVEKTDSVTCGVVSDGTVYSSVLVKYFGWKTSKDTIDVQSQLSIHANTRWTQHSITTSEETNLATGIVKDKLAKVYTSKGGDDSWGYIATYGKQSLNNDNLGLAIMFKAGSFIDFREDHFSHVVELRTTGQKLDYYLGAAWELEPKGITNEADFIKWVERSARELANPVVVTLKDRR
jgi:hypothetical protein